MGAGASIGVPEAFANLAEDEKLGFIAKYEKLKADGKSDEEALAELQQPQLKVKKIIATNLVDEIEAVVAANKTPLVVDASDSDIVNTFYSYRSVVIVDGKKMGLDKTMKKIPVKDIMDETRSKLVAALKMGVPFVIAMTKSVTDFATTFNDTAARENHGLGDGTFLPIEMFEAAGKGLLADDKLDALFRDSDRTDTAGFAVSRNPDGFYIVFTTQFSPDDYEEYLFGNEWGLPKPKDKYIVLIVSAE